MMAVGFLLVIFGSFFNSRVVAGQTIFSVNVRMRKLSEYVIKTGLGLMLISLTVSLYKFFP